MKSIRIFILLSCALALVFCFAVSTAVAGVPENHKEYLKNEGYKNAFDQFTAGMEEAKERLTSDEYQALEKGGGEVIAASVKEDTESGTSEAEAYETAYWMRYEQISRELRRDWLRKNPEGVQGFYRLQSDSFNGYMAIEKGEEDNEYAVEIEVTMKEEPHNSGYIDGFGKLSGGKILMSDDDSDEQAVIITFDGETTNIVTSQAFKKSGYVGAGVTLDGEYLREKR